MLNIPNSKVLYGYQPGTSDAAGASTPPEKRRLRRLYPLLIVPGITCRKMPTPDRLMGVATSFFDPVGGPRIAQKR